MRHGVAIERGTPGFEDDLSRPLTPKGRRQLRKTIKAIQRLAGKFDLIISSPVLRAKQTAEIVAGEMKLKAQVRYSNALAPAGTSAAILLRQLEREKPAPKKILLVGHEPDLSGLVAQFVTGGQTLALDFKKGGLCKLEAENLRVGQCATLAWLLTPKQLKMLD
jgi:phosphohistidine phosphatase